MTQSTTTPVRYPSLEDMFNAVASRLEFCSVLEQTIQAFGEPGEDVADCLARLVRGHAAALALGWQDDLQPGLADRLEPETVRP